MQRLTHWIDGAARAPLEDRWLEVDDPATGAAFAEVAFGKHARFWRLAAGGRGADDRSHGLTDI